MKNKKLYIIANWKMNPPTLRKAQDLYGSIINNLPRIKNINLIFCPPFIWLSKLIFHRSPKNIFFGAQNIFWEKEKGAFTGEVSAAMIKNLGCKYVILGHSERRAYFNESDEIVNKKIKAALGSKLKPILCIGEAEREQDEFGKPILAAKILEKQIKLSLKDVSKSDIKSLIIAYEPRWAIGTGFSDTPEHIFEAALFIRRVLFQIYGKDAVKKIPILYGGSVSAVNAKNFVVRGGVDGLLVGHLSLNPKEFLSIIKDLIYEIKNHKSHTEFKK